MFSAVTTVSNTAESTGPTSGALVVAGGLGVAKSIDSSGMITSRNSAVTPNGQSSFLARGSVPNYAWWDSDNALNEKRYDIISDGSTLRFRNISDDGSANTSWLSVTRTGTTPGIATFTAKIVATPTATTEGINVGTYAGDPSAPSTGALWFNTSTNRLMHRQGAGNSALVTVDAVQDVSGKTLVSPTLSGTVTLPLNVNGNGAGLNLALNAAQINIPKLLVGGPATPPTPLTIQGGPSGNTGVVVKAVGTASVKTQNFAGTNYTEAGNNGVSIVVGGSENLIYNPDGTVTGSLTNDEFFSQAGKLVTTNADGFVDFSLIDTANLAIGFLKGTAAEVAGVVLGDGVPAWATDTGELRVRDGVTAGGNGLQTITGLKKVEFGDIDENGFGSTYIELNPSNGDFALSGRSNTVRINSSGNVIIDSMSATAVSSAGVTDIHGDAGVLISAGPEPEASVELQSVFGSVHVSSGTFILAAPNVPANASSAGVKGTISYDANYVYVCVATNTWKRAALSSW